jgi:DNA-binding NtrC family response regulator
MTLLHPDGFAFAAGARLHRLGFPVQTFDPRQVRRLAAGRAELVFLIPEAATHAELWARLRVELNQGNHLYVLMLDRADTAAVVRAMRDGAHDAVAMDDDDARWQEAIAGAAQAQALWQELYGGAPLTGGEGLLGRSETLQWLRRTLDKLGPTDVTVLIQGESGVGKEKVAEALHRASRRPVFVSLNCAAIPRELLEAELFGVEKGAFTGALKARAGLVEQAAGGTLFLDEIGELDPAVQPKLLRVLETRRARRVGGEADYAVSARFVGATNRNLETEIARGESLTAVAAQLGVNPSTIFRWRQAGKLG